MGKENSLLFLSVLLLSISFTLVLDLGLENWRNSVSISILDLSAFFTVNWISFPVNCSSSLFSAIYIFSAIVLVGSRKALRSRLGFLVSGSWDPNPQFTFCFFPFYDHLLFCYKIRSNPNSLLLFCLMQFNFSLFNFCKSKSQSPLQFKSFTFLAL